MNTSKLNDWLQIAAAAGVIAGLVLVAYEIRVSNRIGLEQAYASSIERWELIYQLGTSPKIAELWVRAHEGDELTRPEAFVLNNFMDTVLSALDIDLKLQDTESLSVTTENMRGEIQYYVLNDYFERRWSAIRRLYGEHVAGAVDGALNSPSQRDVLAYLDYIRGASDQLEWMHRRSWQESGLGR